MISYMPFLVQAGAVATSSMRAGSIAISRVWGGELLNCSPDERPENFLGDNLKKDGLIQFLGDAGICDHAGTSWLEAFGTWKIPVILFTEPLSTGQIPGTARAYVSLCKEFGVPLIGIVQLGGCWDPYLRRLDGLPWFGYVHSYLLNECLNQPVSSLSSYYLELEDIVSRLKNRFRGLQI